MRGVRGKGVAERLDSWRLGTAWSIQVGPGLGRGPGGLPRRRAVSLHEAGLGFRLPVEPDAQPPEHLRGET
jgi:hypothetical protein